MQKGVEWTLILGYFFSSAASALAHVSGRVEEGQTMSECSQRETAPQLRVLVIFERMGKSEDRRRGWRECHVSQIGLSIGRRLGSE